ncbi:hypothetical protein, conserved [Trypanosoma brucei brucei TREU927]|uniref:Transmembrane protein 188 n=1 Tax=Trypanosoma brucei brucei (strain 927/4 GUTat10.1) TaxID=185431 RepID=Q57VL8_TRYB2|nr:hypothetical protein, conserved [Trypanosoma brucei brucei TREU927]AAX70341.1 hypothetical protein, conserved [Trypanosoma brucei]AAZ12907.1 hypothetical protein, conserved [Trypanosoma brucei brucei TREU927]
MHFLLSFFLPFFLSVMSSKVGQEFSQYVTEISQSQRHHVADRVEQLARHQSRAWYYLVGCVTFTTSSVMLVFRLWGPRHIFKNSVYYTRPLPPAISMGVVLYGILYTCRGMLMRSRICTMMEDYEYELKRISAHHCEEGVNQLAWLQFVTEQLKQGAEHRFDFNKLRS